MALATTCPQCKTSFKVIPDQLKLRRGLVRCGVCQHVFSGIDYLRYVDESGKGKPAATPDAAASQGRSHGPAEGRSGASQAASPGAAAPPARPAQTVIAADDELKTAFFLTDSTFGPYTQARPVDTPSAPVPASVVLPRAGTDFARDFANEGTTRIGSPSGQQSGPPAGRSRAGRADGTESGRRVERSARAERGPETVSGPATVTGQTTARRAGESVADPEPARTPRHVDYRDRHGDRYDEPDTRPPARHTRRRSLLDDDDIDVAAANALARQARESRRQRDGSRGSRSSSPSHRPHPEAPEHGWHSFADYFADHRRSALVIGLALLLALQMVLAFRSEIVSRMPSLRPVLEVASGILGLKIDTVRSLSSLTIESFELQSTERSDQIALNAVLRNRDAHAARWPAMELRLTDPSGAVVVRKVILPTDYLNRTAPRDGLGGRSEWPVRLLLETDTLQLAGYSVELFYP